MAQIPRMRDISDKAGVSMYTASRALAGKPGVSDGTRERVVAIAAELGYVPNAVAAGLKSQASNAIGVLTASGRNQYYSMLVQAIDAVLQESGLHAVTSDAMRGGEYTAELEADSIDQLLQQRVAAIVATFSLSRESMAKLAAWNTPVVFVDSPPPAYASDFPFVGCDNYSASEKVAAYFGQLGIRDAVFLAFPPVWNTRTPREAGFVDRCADLGIQVSVVESANSPDAAFAVVSDILRRGRRPSAIYAANTVLLQGAFTAIRDVGLTVPDDISLLGFDDFDWAALLDPGMTVVDQHIAQIGSIAGQTVLDLVASAGASHAGQRIEVEPHLIIRGSCSPPPLLRP